MRLRCKALDARVEVRPCSRIRMTGPEDTVLQE